ncbi:hypothetical protein FE845_10730 [Marinobacter sp. 1-4A]|uniref:hypothetical protein n=1 Tax=Marinobacter sp. 1-4A TaxID=2582919 RepID=UPI00190615F7|nr:hypothetical protein [Marinobacter sp. 1-4A]MBK1851815.1 hypothetical protein [Marinobacter sp. 1-4A]
MKPNSLFASLTVLGTLMLVSDLAAAQNCAENDGRRRRPGQAAIECLPAVDSPSVNSQQNGTDKTPTSTGQQDQIIRRQAQQRRTNPVSPLPRPQLSDYQASVPVPDRWRIVDSLYEERWWDPYNRNLLKGDKPLYDDWFFSFTGIWDTVYESRTVPTPVGSSSTGNGGKLDLIGNGEQQFFNQNLLMEFVYYKGNTTFKPPDLEFRFLPVVNYNRLELQEVQGVNANPNDGTTRSDSHIGIQGAFVDYHLRNVSANYDFDSVRVGIQPFTNDFRGFLFNDSPVGVRLFGTRSNNIFQYNLGWFRRLEKDTNSGLNDVGQSLRDDDIFVANLYWQDLFKKGLISQFSVLHNRNNEDAFYYDNNDFVARPASIGLEKPRSYQVTYLGYAVDGHIGRLNLSAQAYYAFGDESVGTFRDASTDIQAFFFAMEPSIDFDWFRLRSSFVYASGDSDPFDDKSTGFDAVFENPLIAGADTSYWIRQAVPLIGGGRVALSGRNGILPSLRSSKEQGQANFANPGLRMAGLGFDADVLPTLRVSGNWNLLQFDDTTVLETARNQGGVDRTLGQDISLSAIYRPLNSQNIILRGSYSRLLPGDGFKSLFEDESPDYFLFNLVLTY